jgi:hypothetical protein
VAATLPGLRGGIIEAVREQSLVVSEARHGSISGVVFALRMSLQL